MVNRSILLLWAPIFLTYPGKPVPSCGSFHVTAEGLQYTLLITMKSNTIILAKISLLGTTSFFTLAHALHDLHIPDKLVQLLFFSNHDIHVIYVEYARLINAMSSHPGNNLHTYKAYCDLVGMVLVKGEGRSGRSMLPCSSGGFKGNFWVLDHFALKRSNLILVIILLVVITGLGCLQWGKGLFS
jgi:cobalt/nickel transport system permease protein